MNKKFKIDLKFYRYGKHHSAFKNMDIEEYPGGRYGHAIFFGTNEQLESKLDELEKYERFFKIIGVNEN